MKIACVSRTEDLMIIFSTVYIYKIVIQNSAATYSFSIYRMQLREPLTFDWRDMPFLLRFFLRIRKSMLAQNRVDLGRLSLCRFMKPTITRQDIRFIVIVACVTRHNITDFAMQFARWQLMIHAAIVSTIVKDKLNNSRGEPAIYNVLVEHDWLSDE